MEKLDAMLLNGNTDEGERATRKEAIRQRMDEVEARMMQYGRVWSWKTHNWIECQPENCSAVKKEMREKFARTPFIAFQFMVSKASAIISSSSQPNDEKLQEDKQLLADLDTLLNGLRFLDEKAPTDYTPLMKVMVDSNAKAVTGETLQTTYFPELAKRVCQFYILGCGINDNTENAPED